MKSKKCGGFSLIEIIIAVTLSVLLLSAVLQNYRSAKNIYRSQNDLTDLNESIRFADFILWQNITQAGFAGCRRISDLNIKNQIGENFDLSKDVYGYEYDQIPSYLVHKVKKGTDVIVVNKIDADIAHLLKNTKAKVTLIEADRNPATKDEDYLLISDCQKGEMFTSANHQGRTIESKEQLEYAYNKGNTNIGHFEEKAFFISDTGRKNEKGEVIYGLYFSVNRGNKVELVSGVSDMRVCYGLLSSSGLTRGSSGQFGVRDWGIACRSAKEVSDKNLWDQVVIVKIELTMQVANKHVVYIKLRGVY